MPLCGVRVPCRRDRPATRRWRVTAVNTHMRIAEVTQPMPSYRARIRIKAATVITVVSAESLTQARQLLQYLYGTDNVVSISAISK